MKNIFSKYLSLLLVALLTQLAIPVSAQAEGEPYGNSYVTYIGWSEKDTLGTMTNTMGCLHRNFSTSVEYGNEGNDLELEIYYTASDYEFGSDRTVRAVMSEAEYRKLLESTVNEEHLMGFPGVDVSVSLYFDSDRKLSDTDMINIMDILSNNTRYGQKKVNLDGVHKTLEDASISNDEKMALVYVTLGKIIMDYHDLTDEYGLGLLDVLKERGKITVDNKLYADKSAFSDMGYYGDEIPVSPIWGMIDEFVEGKPKTDQEIEEFIKSITEGEFYFELYPIKRRNVIRYYDTLIRARINGEDIDYHKVNPIAMEYDEMFGDVDSIEMPEVDDDEWSFEDSKKLLQDLARAQQDKEPSQDDVPEPNNANIAEENESGEQQTLADSANVETSEQIAAIAEDDPLLDIELPSQEKLEDDNDNEMPEQKAAIGEDNPFLDIELPTQGNKGSKKFDESGYLLYSNVDTFTYENGKKNIALKLYLSASDEDYGSKRTARAKLSATEYKELLAKYVTEEKFKDLSVPDKDVSISLFYEFDEELDDDGMVHLLDAVVNKHPNYNININEVHKTLSDPNVSDDDKKVLTYATLAKATLNLETLPDYYKLALVNVIQERGKIAVDEKPFAAVNSATKLLPLLIVLPIVLLGVAFFALKKNRSGKSHAQK